MKKIISVSALLLCMLITLTSCDRAFGNIGGIFSGIFNDECIHEWSEWIVTVEAGCNAEGQEERVCKRCGETQIEAIPTSHKYGEWVNENAATCLEDGIKGHYHCEACGKYFDGAGAELLDLTLPKGQHSYVNGVCSVCGDVSSCDHQKLSYVDIDLKAKYNVCGGTLTYLSCACGSIKELPSGVEQIESAYVGKLYADHDFEYPDYSESDPPSDIPYEMAYASNDMDDEYPTSEIASCRDCGFSLILTDIYEKEEKCLSEFGGMLCIKIGDTVVASDIQMVGISEHSNSELIKICPEDIGACEGSSLDPFLRECWNVYKCLDCDKMTGYVQNYLDYFGGCDSSNQKSEWGTYEDGRSYTRQSLTCPDCGISYKYENTMLAVRSNVKECIYMRERIFTVVNSNGETIIDCYDKYADLSHAFEETRKLCGDTCDEGVTVTQHCTECGLTETYTDSWHDSEERIIDLAEQGLCGGRITADVCRVCGHSDYIENIDTPCELRSDTEEKIMDGVTHTITTSTCLVCNIKIVRDEWVTRSTTCGTDYTRTVSLYAGEELLYSGIGDYGTYRHEWEYSYEFLNGGDSCDDGWICTRTCVKCKEGGPSLWDDTHYTDWKEVDLSSRDCCGDVVEVEYCLVCNKIIYVNSDNCDWTLDEDKSTESLEVYDCLICNSTKSIAITSEINGCENHVVELGTVRDANGEILYEYEYDYIEYEHDYKYTYERVGEDCSEGYYEKRYCNNCEAEDWWHSYGHCTQPEVLFEQSLYGYTIKLVADVCELCEAITVVYDCSDIDWCRSVEDDVVKWYNEELSVTLTVTRTYGEKDENCVRKIVEAYAYTSSEEDMYSYEYTYEQTDHDIYYTYQFLGESCSDGYYRTENCRDCDHYDTDELAQSDHYNEVIKETYKLDDYGIEKAWIELRGCLCGDSIYGLSVWGEYEYSRFYFSWQEENPLGVDIDIYDVGNGYLIGTAMRSNDDGTISYILYAGLDLDAERWGDYDETVCFTQQADTSDEYDEWQQEF